MLVECPNCKTIIVVDGLGRRRLDIPLKNVCDTLQAHKNVKTAAQQLRCSPAYIFKILKENGLKLKNVIKD